MELQFDQIINEKAKLFNLDPLLVKAIIYVESAGDPWAWRYEPKWAYFYKVEEFAADLDITDATERTAQAFSYGLTQCMGSVARELGWMGPLPELFKPDLAIFYGCKKLNQLWQRWPNQKDVISAYNQGSPRKFKDGRYMNQPYVDKVLHNLRQLERRET